MPYLVPKTGTIHTGSCAAVTALLAPAGHRRMSAYWRITPEEAAGRLADGHGHECKSCAKQREREAGR